MDNRKPCAKCNGQGYYLVQPLSRREMEALAVACPDEPVKFVDRLCDCGNSDARAEHETNMAWRRLLKSQPLKSSWPQR